MNVRELGNTIYAAIKDDAVAEAQLRAEFKTLAVTIATDPASAASVTSATVNGQTFSATPLMSNGDRLKLLRWVLYCFDNGGPLSSTAISTF